MYILILTAEAFCNFLQFSFFICKSTVSVFDVNIFFLKKKFKQNQIVNFMNVEKKRRQSNIGNIMLYFLCQTQNNFKTNLIIPMRENEKISFITHLLPYIS